MKTPWTRRLAVGGGALLVLGVVVASLAVQLEAPYRIETLSEGEAGKALVLYHPSRDARFSDDLSMAVARGMGRAGLEVERGTLSRQTPYRPEGHLVVVVVSNTYYWAPDRPTLRYLRRADLSPTPALGIMGGAGSTSRAERLLGESLHRAGAPSVETRSFWLLRPNDEDRLDEPNRAVALDEAERLAYEVAARLAVPASSPRE